MHRDIGAWRKKGLKPFVVSVLVMMATLLLTTTALYARPFVFVSLPDTQVYSENRFPDGNFPPVTDPLGTGHIFGDQTQWIVDNAWLLGIRYVGHLGDIVQDGDNLEEWALAKAAMNKLLYANIPHGTVMGNHDENHDGDYNQNYQDNFGPQVFDGRKWYVDASPSGGGNFQLLKHKGQKIGFINFSIDQPQEEIDWANNIIKNNLDTLFIIGTHRYMYDYKLIAGRYNEVNVTPLGTFQVVEGFTAPDSENPNYGQEMYEEIIANNPNVMMLHCGHFHSEWMRLTDRSNMEQAIEILTDYQDARNGGDGWLRVYSMDLKNNIFAWDTYSPTLNEFRSTLHHFVETIQQAYVQREQVKALLGFPDDATYLGWLEANLKDNPQIPDGFLTLHPDWDQSYFNQYLSDMFNGSIPVGFDNILEWENLWMFAFAADQNNPLDFSNGYRSPSGWIEINYDNYVCNYARIFHIKYDDDDLKVKIAPLKNYSASDVESVKIISIDGEEVDIFGELDGDGSNKRWGKRKWRRKTMKVEFEIPEQFNQINEVCIEIELSDGNQSCPTCVQIDDNSDDF